MDHVTTKNKSFGQAMPIADLLPGLSKGILSKAGIQTLTAKKQPRATMVISRTAEKNMRALTIAELRATCGLALQPHRDTQAPPQSSRQRGWNSSIKVDYKKMSHTANGQMKNNPVRKVLDFQPQPKVSTVPRLTMNSETPKFPKPEFKAKKSIYAQAKCLARISGVCKLPETPAGSVNPIKSRLTIANKENNPYQANVKSTVPVPTPKSILKTPKSIIKRLPLKVPDSILANTSWKSGSDASFIQKEKEINDIEDKVKAMSEEQTLEDIAEVSPPVSTPFKEYRSVQEYFNNSSVAESSALCDDNTIMCFDKPSDSEEPGKREESVIVSLCDLFNKATVKNKQTEENTELDNLLEFEKETENNIKMIENGIQIFTGIKAAQLKALQNVRKLINEKRNTKTSESETDKTLTQSKTPNIVIIKTPSPVKSPIISRPCSVIKSPTYKIPKKNLNLRKKIICKSMPNVAMPQSPVRDFDNRALSMYMKMKDQMPFLSTPSVNRIQQVPDTPAITSHNLQKQLDKLYNGS